MGVRNCKCGPRYSHYTIHIHFHRNLDNFTHILQAAFFARKWFAQLFCIYSLCLYFFGKFVISKLGLVLIIAIHIKS